ncbi:hypothetical protein OAN307_c29750 [Octadecabacter antarcticus 307]|uniref:Flagellar assembly protein T N-terminal domain-containing protein n=1 Tax=Octadecabacter antarcticus 307 TaxID=391626 RepID=M9RFE4_9RHOB|nr:flagellar assembly protein T N-terminal domain-containing protein [Octadecabacter antarcticus]AGI68525.1 hypothetical protein OAN307_c29750 [Octadecabacter antarcticus 307]
MILRVILKYLGISRCLLAVIFLVALGQGPSFADMVRVTGRAALIDGDTALAQRRALEDALYLAALAGGADVSGFSMADRGVLTGESVLVRPGSRILDYSVLRQGPSNNHYEVEIDAYVGAVPEIGCAMRPAVRLIAGHPQIHAGQRAPLWTDAALEQAHVSTIRLLESTPRVDLSTSDISFAPDPQARSNVPDGFDYRALLTGRANEPASTTSNIPDSARALHLSWHATAPSLNSHTLTVTLSAQIIDPAAPNRARQISTRQTVAISANTPWRTVNVLARRDASKVAEIVALKAAAELSNWLDDYACAPLQGELVAAGAGQFRINLGSRDGLTHQSLAFVEGHGQPWTVFRIVELTASSSTVSPLNINRAGRNLEGANVRFELGG